MSKVPESLRAPLARAGTPPGEPGMEEELAALIDKPSDAGAAVAIYARECGLLRTEVKQLRAELRAALGDASEDDTPLNMLSLIWIGGEQGEEWQEEFWAWYKPDQWLGVHRAVNAFVSRKVADAREAGRANGAASAELARLRKALKDALVRYDGTTCSHPEDDHVALGEFHKSVLHALKGKK